MVSHDCPTQDFCICEAAGQQPYVRLARGKCGNSNATEHTFILTALLHPATAICTLPREGTIGFLQLKGRK